MYKGRVLAAVAWVKEIYIIQSLSDLDYAPCYLLFILHPLYLVYSSSSSSELLLFLGSRSCPSFSDTFQRAYRASPPAYDDCCQEKHSLLWTNTVSLQGQSLKWKALFMNENVELGVVTTNEGRVVVVSTKSLTNSELTSITFNLFMFLMRTQSVCVWTLGLHPPSPPSGTMVLCIRDRVVYPLLLLLPDDASFLLCDS